MTFTFSPICLSYKLYGLIRYKSATHNSLVSYVIKVAVHTIWCRLSESLVNSNLFIVVDSIKANHFFQPLHFFVRPSKSNDSAAYVFKGQVLLHIYFNFSARKKNKDSTSKNVENFTNEFFPLPLILAICPTCIPTAPAAAFTTTVSPALGVQSSKNPKYAELLEILLCYINIMQGQQTELV